MIYNYARVSTDAQGLATQLSDLTAATCEEIVWEKTSGANAERPKLKHLMARLRHGDQVKVTTVDRLARNPADLLLLARKCIVENKAQDVRFGHKPKLMPRQKREAAARLAAGEPQRSVACSFNVYQSTIVRLPSPETAHG